MSNIESSGVIAYTFPPPQTENELFLQSRKSSESVKAREQALQSLDLSYYKYKEIMQNLEEGVNVRSHAHFSRPFILMFVFF